MKGLMTLLGILTIIVWSVGLMVFGFNVAAYPVAAVVIFKLCSFCTIIEIAYWAGEAMT